MAYLKALKAKYLPPFVSIVVKKYAASLNKSPEDDIVYRIYV